MAVVINTNEMRVSPNSDLSSHLSYILASIVSLGQNQIYNDTIIKCANCFVQNTGLIPGYPRNTFAMVPILDITVGSVEIATDVRVASGCVGIISIYAGTEKMWDEEWFQNKIFACLTGIFSRVALLQLDLMNKPTGDLKHTIYVRRKQVRFEEIVSLTNCNLSAYLAGSLIQMCSAVIENASDFMRVVNSFVNLAGLNKNYQKQTDVLLIPCIFLKFSEDSIKLDYIDRLSSEDIGRIYVTDCPFESSKESDAYQKGVAAIVHLFENLLDCRIRVRVETSRANKFDRIFLDKISE